MIAGEEARLGAVSSGKRRPERYFQVGLGKFDAAPGQSEQRYLKFALELSDCMRQARLRDVQTERPLARNATRRQSLLSSASAGTRYRSAGDPVRYPAPARCAACRPRSNRGQRMGSHLLLPEQTASCVGNNHCLSAPHKHLLEWRPRCRIVSVPCAGGRRGAGERHLRQPAMSFWALLARFAQIPAYGGAFRPGPKAMRGNRNTNTSAQWGAHVTDRRGRQHKSCRPATSGFRANRGPYRQRCRP